MKIINEKGFIELFIAIVFCLVIVLGCVGLFFEINEQNVRCEEKGGKLIEVKGFQNYECIYNPHKNNN